MDGLALKDEIRILFAAVVACWVVFSVVPAAWAVDYYAFGDSVTRGEGGGWILDREPPALMGSCTLQSGYPTNCGYHWRLDNSLNGAGITATVHNRGAAGETTAAGLTRVDSVLSNRCTSSASGDVLLLMEGTNDISNGVSTATIKANLGAILNKAKNKCVHAAIATTIRRLNLPNHVPTRNLRDAIFQLSSSKQRPLVHPYALLCANTTCYNTHYWAQFSPGDPGHIDASGYNVMAPLFHDVIVGDPAPGTATTISPTGLTTDTTPTFSWNEVGGVVWYYLQVNGPGGGVYSRWLAKEDICSGGVCNKTLTTALGDGNYSWQVRTRNLRGVGSWSTLRNFTIGSPVTEAPTLVSPTGEVFTDQPQYQWNTVANTDDYELEALGTSGIIPLGTFTAASACSGSLCTATPAVSLMAGDYSWRARGANTSGDGPWSGYMEFSVYLSAPAAPVPIYPLDKIFDTTPTFRWPTVPGATGYWLNIDGSSTPYDEATICSGSLCEFTVAGGDALADGVHTWRLRTYNPLGSGPLGPVHNFEILACSAPTTRSLPNTTTSGDVTERACDVLEAVQGYIIQSTHDVFFHGGNSVVLGNGFEAQNGGLFTAVIDY